MTRGVGFTCRNVGYSRHVTSQDTPISGSGNTRIKAVRVLAGLTQADLALAIGVSRQTISMLEAGAHNPTLRLCLDIARTLGTDLNSLFWEESEDN